MKKIISVFLLLCLFVPMLTACDTKLGSKPELSKEAGTAAPATSTEGAKEAETTAEAAPEATPVPEGSSSAKLAQGVTDTEIIVGNTAATSGALAPVGVPFNAGIEAYFKMVNEAGGINGRLLKFVHSDDEFDPAKGKAMLQTMVEDDKIFAVVGAFGTPVVAATLPDLQEYGIPTVYFATGIGQLYNAKAEGSDRMLFPVQPIYTTEGEIMVVRAVGDFKAKKIGIIYTNDDAGKDMLKGAESKATALGVELVAEQVAAGATDVSAAVTVIKKAEVDFVIAAAIQQTVGTIVKALAAQDMDKDVITTYVNVAPVIAGQVYADIKGKFDLYGNGWVSVSEPSSLEALKNIAQWSDSPDYAANPFAMSGWIAASFFVEGLKRVGSKDLTWENYLAAMEEAPIANPFGGAVDFTEGKRIGTTVMNLSKVKDDTTWEEVYPLEDVETILNKK